MNKSAIEAGAMVIFKRAIRAAGYNPQTFDDCGLDGLAMLAKNFRAPVVEIARAWKPATNHEPDIKRRAAQVALALATFERA